MTSSTRRWGLTDPLSNALPTDKELEMTETLLKELRAQGNFEAPEATEKRKQVLKHFQEVTLAFVRLVGQQKGLPASSLDDAGGMISTFGSYRLGVFGPGSDIDTLVVAPKHVTREDFFKHFPSLLAEKSPKDAIEESAPVPNAAVPIIKFKYSGISIDLIFVSLSLSSIPENLDLKEMKILRGLTEADSKSLNGTRVTDEILTLVPQVKTFRLALRAIKMWAQARAVYGNVIGFPGGVAWAMMVARICQCYPMATASTVVLKFFTLMAGWPWPRPVQLKEIEEGPFNFRTWNPMIYGSDKNHLMPVITPAYPSMCATHNITLSTKTVINRELEHAMKITNEIMDGKKPWKELFKRHAFFTEGYKYYLSVTSASRTKEAQSIWSGTVQSKIRRFLVSGIEISAEGVEIAHPFNEGFDRIHNCKNEDEVQEVLSGSMKYQVSVTKTTEEVHDFKQSIAAQGADALEMPTENGHKANPDGTFTIYTTTFYVGIELSPGEKSLDISYPVTQFKNECVSWDQYNAELNSVRVVHIRNYDLPDDVFKPGEKRPVKATKKTKKRTQQDAGLTDDSKGVKRHQTNGIAASAG
ncbi:Poly(A) polymerase papa [Patellaria atrata CBS 101060]|uniref:Poly(A) polymerase n=1 Tax=Patellaria atrata CBS 101060 TaxID=1346257 RepID=A0A9P4SL24_9PEZI|nr:Poly(A) polymerase papa [Patellaria atrata CBS 101060]